jgi:hypothetical protein
MATKQAHHVVVQVATAAANNVPSERPEEEDTPENERVRLRLPSTVESLRPAPPMMLNSTGQRAPAPLFGHSAPWDAAPPPLLYVKM